MSKKLLITENDKEYIKRLYGIVSEQNYGFQPKALEPQNVTPPESYKQVVEPKNFGGFSERILFPAGYYSTRFMNSTNLVTNLKKLIDQIYPSKISQGPFNLIVTTEASESQIPNTDNEKGGELNAGDLANLRNTTINLFIQNFIKKNYPELKEPNFVITLENTTPKIGTTPWVGSSYLQALLDCGIVSKLGDLKYNPNACTQKLRQWVTNLKKSYDSEQYNGLQVELMKAGSESETKFPKPMKSKENCLRGLKIKVYYENNKKHTCNSSVYEIYVNDVLMNRDRDGAPYISLNNKGLMDNAGFKLGQAFVPISDKSDKKELRYMVNSNDEGGSREDIVTVTDEKIESSNSLNGNINIKFVCRNLTKFIKSPEDLTNMVKIPGGISKWQTNKFNNQMIYGGTDLYFANNEWISKWWGNGCHESVGKIEITNTLGKKLVLALRTPTQKDNATYYNDIDPCSLTMDRSLIDQGENIKLKPLQY